MSDIRIDFSNVIDEIRPLHGVNNAPMCGYGTFLPKFYDLEVPFVRLHDTRGEYGGSHYVDVPNIFPDFDADPEDENSYDFFYTDLYLKELVENGIEIFYRLGVTNENGPKKYRIFPPKDFKKWAIICEHIIRHYNCGWANGYHWNIKYWEIWNEPDGNDPNVDPNGPPGWQGTVEEFYELYSITANHLKQMHPDIKIGGYGACLIRGSFIKDRWVFGETRFLDGFLKYITSPETKAPMDFVTFHTYVATGELDKYAKDVQFAKKKFAEYGFENIECIDGEWGCYLSLPDRNMCFVYMRNEMGASYQAAAMNIMQINGMDKAMYYEADLWRAYGTLFEVPGYKPTKSYYAFYFFNKLYRLKNSCLVEGGDELYPVAAYNEGEGAIVICNPYEMVNKVNLKLEGIDIQKAEVYRIDIMHDGEKVRVDINEEMALPPYSVTLIRLNSKD